MTRSRKSTITKIRTRSIDGCLPAVVIGQVLREARRGRGMTQQQLADPFSTAFVCSVELGNTMPSLPSLAILLGHMGMSMAEFFIEVERRADRLAQAVDG
jgi:transcriptional regulator with XRE-family HTH domain